jgi:hypothetical protein
LRQDEYRLRVVVKERKRVRLRVCYKLKKSLKLNITVAEDLAILYNSISCKDSPYCTDKAIISTSEL